jgi:hypothetical protein
VSTTLEQALDQLVPPCLDEAGEWQRVLTAASDEQPVTGLRTRHAVRHGRNRLNRRQLAVIAVAFAAIAVLFATPAFGLRDLIVDFISGRTSVSFVKAEPAPARIKKEFLDFSLGAPPGMGSHVLPAQARQITFRSAAGEKRVLWVAPTRGGGFCSILVGAGGGCISKKSEHQFGPIDIGGAFSQARGQEVQFREISGHVFSGKATTLTLVFQDGQSMSIPFVYVSRPINAGFFIAGVPASHQTRGHWPSEVIARNAKGQIIATKKIQMPASRPQSLRPGKLLTPRTRILPTAPPVAPSTPMQTGNADGFSVVVGHNGAVQFTEIAQTPALARLSAHSVSYSCFRLTREFGIFTVRGLGQEASFASKVGFQLYGVGTPVDGCDIQGSGGHRWPDQLDSHSPVEIALTATGRDFFADRAAARDLALFVRSARMQKIRKEPGPELLRDMKAAYGADLAGSRIRYALTAGGITFTEKSTSGKLFHVAVVHGRIAHNNVEPYAFVH